jgi:hypothetical protein
MKFYYKVTILSLFAALPSLTDAKLGNKHSRSLKKKAKATKRPTKNPTPSPPAADPFDYPEDMPPPPEMWVEGFASRLHAQNIQKYETPIQVWQTWRLDPDNVELYRPLSPNSPQRNHQSRPYAPRP